MYFPKFWIHKSNLGRKPKNTNQRTRQIIFRLLDWHVTEAVHYKKKGKTMYKKFVWISLFVAILIASPLVNCSNAMPPKDEKKDEAKSTMKNVQEPKKGKKSQKKKKQPKKDSFEEPGYGATKSDDYDSDGKVKEGHGS